MPYKSKIMTEKYDTEQTDKIIETDEQGTRYREEALLEYAKAHQSSQLTQIITPRAWILLLVVIMLLVSVLAWFFLGTVVTRIHGEGVIIEDSGSMYSISFQGKEDGYVETIQKDVGQKVIKGDVLALIHNDDQMHEILDMQDQINTLEEAYKQQKERIKKRQHLSDNLALYNAQAEDELSKLKLELIHKKIILQRLKAIFLSDNTVVAPVDGYISSVMINEGDRVVEGVELFRISLGNEKLIVQAYISAHEAKIIKEGMLAEVVPTFTEQLEYGAIKGTVLQVADYPETLASITALLKNRSLVANFWGHGPAMAVKIGLQKNKNNPSGVEWSSSRGPNTLLTKGTLVDVYVVVDKQHPVSFILPRAEYATHVMAE